MVTFKLPVKAVAKLLAGSRQPASFCGIIITFFFFHLLFATLFSFEFTCAHIYIHMYICMHGEERVIIITTHANENVTHPPRRRSDNAAMKMYNGLFLIFSCLKYIYISFSLFFFDFSHCTFLAAFSCVDLCAKFFVCLILIINHPMTRCETVKVSLSVLLSSCCNTCANIA